MSWIAHLAALCSVAVVVPASADFIYKTEITLLPGSSGVSHRVVSKGETRVFYDANTYFVSMPVPSQSSPSRPIRMIQFFDGTNSYTNVLGARPDGSVVLGKVGSAFTSPAIMSLLGRHPQAGTIITPRAATSGACEIEEYREGSSPVRSQTNYTKDGRIQSIWMYFADQTAASPIATYTVKAVDKKGLPNAIEVIYFENGKPCRIEKYTLIRLSPAISKTPSDVFQSGQEVIDERLGTRPEDQVRYQWYGTLPSINDLKRMRGPVAALTSGVTMTRLIPAAVVLLLGGTWLAMRSRKNRRAS